MVFLQHYMPWSYCESSCITFSLCGDRVTSLPCHLSCLFVFPHGACIILNCCLCCIVWDLYMGTASYRNCFIWESSNGKKWVQIISKYDGAPAVLMKCRSVWLCWLTQVSDLVLQDSASIYVVCPGSLQKSYSLSSLLPINSAWSSAQELFITAREYKDSECVIMRGQFKMGQPEALLITVENIWTASPPLLPCSLPADWRVPTHTVFHRERWRKTIVPIITKLSIPGRDGLQTII